MKSLSDIQSTKIEYVYPWEGNVKNTFVSAYNQAFPLKVEELYVTLTNLIFDYCATCGTLKAQDKQLYVHAINLQCVYNTLDSLEAAESVQSRLQDAEKSFDDNPTPEALKKVNDAKEMLEKRSTANEQIASLNAMRYNCEETIAVERGELERIIAEISIALQAIAALNIDGKRRIDGLHIKQNHLSAIDNLAISPLEKDALKREFVSYFNMRCTAFKYVEELAEKILASYSKREVLNGLASVFGDKLDKDFEIYRIALQTLYVYPNCIHTFGVACDLICEEKNANCDMIDIITGYLKDGTFNQEAYLDAMHSPELNCNLNSIALSVMFDIERMQTSSLQRK